MDRKTEDRPLLRLLLLGPPLFAAIASVPVLLAAFAAWGIASGSGYPAALPTFAGLVAGVPILALGIMTWRGLKERARHNFSAVVPFALLSAIAYIGVGLFQLALAARIADRATYHGLRPEEISPSGFAFTVVGAPLSAFVMISFISLLAVLSTTAGRRPRPEEEERPDPFARPSEKYRPR